MMFRISLRAKVFIEVDKERGGGGTTDWLQVFTVGETELMGLKKGVTGRKQNCGPVDYGFVSERRTMQGHV